MSQPNFNDNDDLPTYRKARADMYTVALVLSLAALLVGCVCLYAEMSEYGFKIKGGPLLSLARPAIDAPALTAVACHDAGPALTSCGARSSFA